MYNYYNDDNYEAGKVIVALKKGLDCSLTPDAYANYILNGIDFQKLETVFHPTKAKNESSMGEIILVHLKQNDKLSVMDAVEKLSANPYVIYAEPSYFIEIHRIPNDPYFSYLWGIKKVQPTRAWNYSTGGPDVTVGVIDSGIDYDHPDIKNNMWISPDELLNNGWNFWGDNDNPMDSTGHGTHVAGTIGAVGNNCLGITGICWKVQVASLRIGHLQFSLEAAIEAINFANTLNIPILNGSWGSRHNSPILKYAIEQYDGLFIASAGNYGDNNDFFPVYPASYDSDNIISVAATNPDDTLASFSNYGVKSVDIAAPGTDIFSLSLHGGYSNQSGTSMSAPHVAGAAALLKAYMPDLTASDIKSIILSSAEKHQSLEGKILTGGILNVDAMFETANQKSRDSH